MGGVFYIYRNLDFLEVYKSKILCPFGGKSLKKESQEISKKNLENIENIQKNLSRSQINPKFSKDPRILEI